MKRRHFISFVFVLILCIGMIGCGKEKKTTASDKFQSDYMEIGVGTTVEKGYFGVINGLLYYVDFETMNAVPICNKPDCRHISWMEDRNTKCNAANTDIWNLFPYKGKLYGFRSLADGGSELVVSDLDGSNWKSKGMFIKAEESFHEGVVVKDQMFYLKDVALREEEAAEPELETVMCMLDLDTMKSREICRERGTFSIQFLGGTKDYQIYSVKGEDGVTCYQFDYKKEVSKEISLYDIPGRIIGADETGFYYNSGIDYPSAVYRYHFETGENEVFVSKEEAKAAYGKDVFSLSLWDVREEGILFKIWYGEDQRLFLKEADSGKLRQLSLSEELLKEDFVDIQNLRDSIKHYKVLEEKLKISKKECESLEGVVSQYDTYLDTHFQMDVLECLKEKLQEKQLQAIIDNSQKKYQKINDQLNFVQQKRQYRKHRFIIALPKDIIV